MISLNLVNKEKSQIGYEISRFPDGQQTIEIKGFDEIESPLRLKSWKQNFITIRSRLNNFKDLELIICAVGALRNLDPDMKISLITPYFIGARSDRKFTKGGVNYLKQVICPIINSLNFRKVTVLDPHSDVLEACLNNFNKLDNLLPNISLDEMGKNGDIVLISPDSGAYKKIFDVARDNDIENIITASKVRDIKTGNIIETKVPDLEKYKDHKFVIVDDICDGGRTFLEIAKKIKEVDDKSKIYLIVTHGIFSKGFDELNLYFDKIYTTNSYSEFDSNDKLSVIDYF